MSETIEAEDVEEEMGEIGGTATWAALGSVGLALYFYYVRGDKQRGQFIGLWPGTILSLATMKEIKEIQQKLDSHDH